MTAQKPVERLYDESLQVVELNTMTLTEFRALWTLPGATPAYVLVCTCCKQQFASGGPRHEPITVTFECPSCKSGKHLKGWVGERHPDAECPIEGKF